MSKGRTLNECTFNLTSSRKRDDQVSKCPSCGKRVKRSTVKWETISKVVVLLDYGNELPHTDRSMNPLETSNHSSPNIKNSNNMQLKQWVTESSSHRAKKLQSEPGSQLYCSFSRDAQHTSWQSLPPHGISFVTFSIIILDFEINRFVYTKLIHFR